MVADPIAVMKSLGACRRSRPVTRSMRGVRILLWHGWILEGSGSNVVTARTAEVFRAAGHASDAADAARAALDLFERKGNELAIASTRAFLKALET